ncbi:Fpg/Nei family DNA glycosylase [Tomitella fengzijianii]|uniref:Endonuclease 8 1 n=1 Tax=Tomitella fengzijianii TaxID=2597660 RepID=A0A516X4R0_9ACTN|nr:DNA-formamidopyrimidine glycosylase family protein [Tomitella fengzijianii]QDQ98062.1 Fpg/Nei family DNA glycosylase [Tomitella fengzijianii]
MPEGHTVHRLAAIHEERFAGRPVRVSSPQGRFAQEARLVDGRVLERADAYGKHLLHFYDVDLAVHVHLGIYGVFEEEKTPMDPPRGQVRMRMVGAEFGTDLRGPTRCEVVDHAAVDRLRARLGPDPLRAEADPERAWRRIARSRAPIGGLLMDQSVVAGVGNVYRAEVLFRQGIDPMRPGRSLSAAEWDALWADLVSLMAVGVTAGGIVVVRDEHDHGDPAYAKGKPRTYVYRRAGSPCRVCGTTVLRTEMQGRNLFWCPHCQS